MRKINLLISLALLAACLPACQPGPVYTPPPDWKYADLRGLDPADNIPAAQDWSALYPRRLGEEVEIRLDLIDISTIQDYELLIRLASAADETISIVIP